MADRSILESDNDYRMALQTQIVFGRITKVYPERRTCEVKTFMGHGPSNDNHIPECQWLSTDSHPDGDESGVIPRVNSYGVIAYIDGEPFILGYFKPITESGSASVGEDIEELNEGDRVLKTVGKNKIILRSHGEIQIESTRTCRTIYFPDRHLLNTLCRNYEFRTDGGTVDWLNISDDNDTYYRRELRDNISRANLIVEERGKVDGTLISRTVIGAGTVDGVTQPTWSETILTDGTTERFIRAPGAASGHKHTVKPDGTTTLDVAGKTTVKIESSGKTTIDVGPGKATITIDPSGKIDVVAKADVSVTTDANLNATAKGNVTVKATGNAVVDCATASIKAKSNSIKGGAVPANAVNNDPITGIPLTPCGGVTLD